VLPSQAAAPAEAAAVGDLMARLAGALGVRQGPIYAQLKLTPSGPRLIEASPRLDGCHLWLLVAAVTGVDLLAATAAVLAGERPSLGPAAAGRPMTLTMLHRPPGAVLRPADDLIAEDAVAVGYHYAAGEVVRPVNGLMETVGYCLAPAN
jgi:hypothetical protein